MNKLNLYHLENKHGGDVNFYAITEIEAKEKAIEYFKSGDMNAEIFQCIQIR